MNIVFVLLLLGLFSTQQCALAFQGTHATRSVRRLLQGGGQQRQTITPRQSFAALIVAMKADKNDVSLDRTASHLKRLQEMYPSPPDGSAATENEDQPQDILGMERQKVYQMYIQQSAHVLKQELSKRELPIKGRKPDLAARLAQDDLEEKYGLSVKHEDQISLIQEKEAHTNDGDGDKNTPATLTQFAGLTFLSHAAATALGNARFTTATPIQQAAIRPIVDGETVLLHAETGSGKTLAYLLPITEKLWQEEPSSEDIALILTPTRELASQVAGIATVLAPPGTVRLVSRPTNLMSNGIKERGQEAGYGGISARHYEEQKPRLIIGTAKSILHSLFGDKTIPAPPTSKPEASMFMKNVRYLVLDEVDRLLGVRKSKSEKKATSKRHDKPAATLTSAILRLTFSQVQIVAASATVGRPLRRELTRVMGLTFQECPRVILGETYNDSLDGDMKPTLRAVTLPDTIQNFLYCVDNSSSGTILTSAYRLVQKLQSEKPRKILMVLTKGFDINTQNVIGALKHFKCKPQPQSLLDALESNDGTDYMIEKYRQVAGAGGVGESYFQKGDKNESYLFVTGEDTVRGLHLDGLDTVIILGRAKGPDEYTHIAGRTGRAGMTGNVINVVSAEDAASLESWQRMLHVKFTTIGLDQTGMVL